MITKENYQTQITNGETNGLVLELISNTKHIILNFGVVLAVRMLDEGIVQKEIYSNREIDKYKTDGFKNIIYQVTNGEFASQIQNISDGYWETYEAKHYIVITQNYNIDIITEWEPELNIN